MEPDLSGLQSRLDVGDVFLHGFIGLPHKYLDPTNRVSSRLSQHSRLFLLHSASLRLPRVVFGG